MKIELLDCFKPVLEKFKPLNICEIGTHHGNSAIQFIDILMPFVPAKHKLNYTGYDLFEDADEALTKYEINGKGPGSYKRAKGNLEHRVTKYKKKFSYNLIRGNTFDTLKDGVYDFVYIDGGHSYNTVKHDYEKVKDSKIIVFDDCQLPEVRSAVDEIIADLQRDYEIVKSDTPDIPNPKQIIVNEWEGARHKQVCLIKGNYS